MSIKCRNRNLLLNSLYKAYMRGNQIRVEGEMPWLLSSYARFHPISRPSLLFENVPLQSYHTMTIVAEAFLSLLLSAVFLVTSPIPSKTGLRLFQPLSLLCWFKMAKSHSHGMPLYWSCEVGIIAFGKQHVCWKRRYAFALRKDNIDKKF
jgi:hypothetical protein